MAKFRKDFVTNSSSSSFIVSNSSDKDMTRVDFILALLGDILEDAKRLDDEDGYPFLNAGESQIMEFGDHYDDDGAFETFMHDKAEYFGWNKNVPVDVEFRESHH